jgi:hypothetical protein
MQEGLALTTLQTPNSKAAVAAVALVVPAQHRQLTRPVRLHMCAAALVESEFKARYQARQNIMQPAAVEPTVTPQALVVALVAAASAEAVHH